VEQLKRKVGSKIGVDFRSIRLTFGTKYLVDNFHLGEYLPNQATIHMCTRLLGGNGEKKVKVSTLMLIQYYMFQNQYILTIHLPTEEGSVENTDAIQ